MAIRDYDGTAAYEIGKLRDWDGTATHQIGKVYDNDGTANHLIYSATETIVYNSWDTSIWTTYASGTKGNSTDIAIYPEQVQVNVIPTGTWAGYTAGVRTKNKTDLTDYKTISCYIGGPRWPSSDGWTRGHILVRPEIEGTTVASNYLVPPSSGDFALLTLDVSALEGSYYVFVVAAVYNGSASSSQYNFRAKTPVTFTVK